MPASAPTDTVAVSGTAILDSAPAPNTSGGLVSHDPEKYWENTESSYSHYPTVRHRRRYIMNTLRGRGLGADTTIFDFGCGEGTLIRLLQETLGLRPEQVGGCDISEIAVRRAREKTGSPLFYHGSLPVIAERYDVIICSEVIEHTTRYGEILSWIAAHLRPGGLLLLTTQGGKIHACDRYTGHTQHFGLQPLRSLVEGTGLRVLRARKWGFPFFTTQKYLTDRKFHRVQKLYLEGRLTLRKHLVFSAAYLAYFIHDLLPWGPQLYIVARKAD